MRYNIAYQDLLQRAHWYKLKTDEISDVARDIQKRRPALERDSLLHILSESNDKQHLKLLGKCLYSGDVKLRKMAL